VNPLKKADNPARRIGVFLLLIGLSSVQLAAESKSIRLLFFHFESRSYQLDEHTLPDSIETYIRKYGPWLTEPESLKMRMLGDLDFAKDQLAQKRIFGLLDRFKNRIFKRDEFKNIDLTIKVHFILWDEALEYLQREAKNPTYNIVQIGPEFLGGISEYGNVIPLDPFIGKDNLTHEFARTCLQTCRVGGKGPLLAFPFWVSMRTLFVRKDMLAAVPEINPDEAFSSWPAFERAGRLFNGRIDSLRKMGFPNLKSFWAINIRDKDMNTLQNLTPVIYSHGGSILEKRFWWKEAAFDRQRALDGIRTYFKTAKSVGSLEESSFGALLNNFHSGHYAVVLCGTWDYAYWRGTNPDSSSLIAIKLPPSDRENPATLLEGCNLVILKKAGAVDYRLEYELLRYLSTDPVIQNEYIPSNARLSVFNSAKDSISRPEYYAWLNEPGLTRPFPNNKEMTAIINALTQKYRLASILLNVKGAPELSDEFWGVIKNAVGATAGDLNRQIIPKTIYYAFYSKINILVILLLLCIIGIAGLRLTKRMNVLRKEKDRIESELAQRLQMIQQDKGELEQQQQETVEKLRENQDTIKSLSNKLKQTGEEYDRLRTHSNLEQIEQVSSQLLTLTSKIKTLESELERTNESIREKEEVVSELENEIESLKTPEIYIDFQKMTIRHGNGSEFTLSSAAKQYKHDVFRYLEFIARHQLKRIHLLTFGCLDLPFFRKALADGKVREYNYGGKFAKVKSGINRSFKINIKRDFIIHDDLNIYVYYKPPKSIYQVCSKENEIHLALAPLTSKDRPQVATFSAYDDFDYYALDPTILVRSSIEESRQCFEKARKVENNEEKRDLLEEALFLDPQNIPCLIELLRIRPFEYMEKAARTEKELTEKVETLEVFMNLNLFYDKKFTSMARIKENYKELMSWSYVNREKSDELESVGIAAFQKILEYERTLFDGWLMEYANQRNRLRAFSRSLDHLKNTARFFHKCFDRTILHGLIVEYAGKMDLFSERSPVDEPDAFRAGFIKFLLERIGEDPGSLGTDRPGVPS
jgi:ABC-type glycerol-3-phosphate transport system substrate-binding protein